MMSWGVENVHGGGVSMLRKSYLGDALGPKPSKARTCLWSRVYGAEGFGRGFGIPGVGLKGFTQGVGQGSCRKSNVLKSYQVSKRTSHRTSM